MNSSRSLKASVIAAIAFVLVLFVGLPLLWIMGAKAKLRQADADALKERQAARVEKLPLTPSDLRRNPPVPDADNADLIYHQIFAGFKQKKQALADLEKLTEGTRASFSDKPAPAVYDFDAAHKLITLLAPEMTLMEQAAKKPDCDFHRPWEKGNAVLFPEFAELRRIARLLRTKAEVLDHAGKPSEALHQIEIGGALVRHLGKEPTLIAMLVQVAIEAILDRSWHDLVNRHGNDTAFLARAAKVNKAFGDLPSLKNSLRGEVWYGLSTIESMKKGTYKEEEYGLSDEEKAKMPKLNPKMASLYEKNHLIHWRKVFKMLDAAGNDTAKAARFLMQDERDMEAAAKADPQGQAMNALMTPVFSQTGNNVMQTEVLRQMRTLKIALLQYRLAHKAFPKDLSAFDKKLSSDPFSGKALIYRPQGNGYLLYSVGKNGVDDGGQRKVGSSGTADIVTSYP